MAPPFAPKIVYSATPVTINFMYPSHIFVPDRAVQGGASESAAGVPETFVIRKDGLFYVTLVLDESEVAMTTTWIDWTMDNGSQGYFTFYPDQAKGLNYQSWLLKPKVGDRWGFKRHSQYPRALQLDLEMRTRTTGTMYDVRYQ